MNQIVKWNPFAEFEKIHRDLSLFVDSRNLSQSAVAEWAPVVDIIEDERSYVIKAELPEVKREDVNVELEGGVLRISGERKIEKEEKTRKYHRLERAYGVFARSFELPDNIDPNKVSALYRDGVLVVSVAKTEQAQPKHIEVKVN
jgi:HSP20 family protein